MRNKIFIGIAMSLFAVVTVVNMSMVQSNGASDIPLENIAVMAQAQSEGGKIKVKEVHPVTQIMAQLNVFVGVQDP
jgi:hypothetical protein